MSFNKCILVGNLTADPELKQSASGVSVCSFNIAVNRKYNKDGNNECDFITIVAWRQQAEFVCKYFKKGNPILVCGSIQTRSWSDKQGGKRYATEVVADEVTFVGSAQSDTKPAASAPSVSPNNAAYTPESYTQGSIPFGTPASARFEEIPTDGDLPF